jgi:hypothetical protein
MKNKTNKETDFRRKKKKNKKKERLDRTTTRDRTETHNKSQGSRVSPEREGATDARGTDVCVHVFYRLPCAFFFVCFLYYYVTAGKIYCLLVYSAFVLFCFRWCALFLAALYVLSCCILREMRNKRGRELASHFNSFLNISSDN